jgi:2-methylisocitrate lyase-like PEP mutase family enzyme
MSLGDESRAGLDDPEKRADWAGTLRDLHHGPKPLILPNAWDVASARAVAEAGFAVIATSSFAVAESLGFPDTDTMPADDAFAAVARIARGVDLPVTADLEAGYGLSAEEFVQRLLGAGAVGCNFEDSDHHGSEVLLPAERQVERLRALRSAADAAGVPIVINARVDVFIRGFGEPEHRLDEAIRRGKAYIAAGADCVYPIGLTDREAIASFVREVAAPVNIWLRPDGPSRAELAEIGVARISLAAGLFRRAMGEVERALHELQT